MSFEKIAAIAEQIIKDAPDVADGDYWYDHLRAVLPHLNKVAQDQLGLESKPFWFETKYSDDFNFQFLSIKYVLPNSPIPNSCPTAKLRRCREDWNCGEHVFCKYDMVEFHDDAKAILINALRSWTIHSICQSARDWPNFANKNQVARACHVSHNTVSKWLKESKPFIEELPCGTFDVDMAHHEVAYFIEKQKRLEEQKKSFH